MKKLIFLFYILIFFSCNNQLSNERIKEIESLKIDTTLPSDLTYKILKEEVNNTQNKCNLNIQLNRKTTESELKILALKFRETRTNYDNLWIFYTLPGMSINREAWATSHFTPSLEISILGNTIAQDINLKNLTDSVEGRIIGKWQDIEAPFFSYVYFSKQNKYFMKTIFPDGKFSITKILQQNKLNGFKLIQIESSLGEYYFITKTGYLEFYNKENKKFSVSNPM